MKVIKILRNIIFHLLIYGLVLIWVFPVLWVLVSSFKTGNELFSYPLTFLPDAPTFQNYIDVWNQFDFVTYMGNSAFITIVATVLTILISAMCGFALAKYHYKWLNIVFIMLLCTTMLPSEVIMKPSFTVLYRLGLYDTLWGCIIPCIGTMTGVFLMRQFFITVPDETLEAARIDGANEGRIFTRIMLPLCKSQIAILAIFSFKWRWNDYIWPLIALRSKSKYTLQLALRVLSGAEAVDWTALLSASIITMIPVLIVFVIFNKQIMSAGLSAGVKG